MDLPSAGVRVLGGGGESGLSIPSLRAWLYEDWGPVRLLDAYGISELAWCANSCLACDGAGVHVHERTHHSYSADPTSGEPVGEGQVGENVVTAFRLGQILIKYRTHDLVRRFRHHDHGCGLTSEFLEGSVLARTDSMVTIRGVNVYPTAVENIVGSVDGATPYFEIHIHRHHDLDALNIRLESAHQDESGFRPLAAAVADKLRRHLGLRVDVEVLAAGSLPRYESKSKRIIDHRMEA
jgi:phenylacetate-CoA ligase